MVSGLLYSADNNSENVRLQLVGYIECSVCKVMLEHPWVWLMQVEGNSASIIITCEACNGYTSIDKKAVDGDEIISMVFDAGISVHRVYGVL